MDIFVSGHCLYRACGCSSCGFEVCFRPLVVYLEELGGHAISSLKRMPAKPASNEVVAYTLAGASATNPSRCCYIYGNIGLFLSHVYGDVLQELAAK